MVWMTAMREMMRIIWMEEDNHDDHHVADEDDDKVPHPLPARTHGESILQMILFSPPPSKAKRLILAQFDPRTPNLCKNQLKKESWPPTSASFTSHHNIKNLPSPTWGGGGGGGGATCATLFGDKRSPSRMAQKIKSP